MNSLVKIGAGLFAAFLLFSMIGQCGRNNSSQDATRSSFTPPTYAAPASTDMIMREYAKGLDLKAVSDLAKKAKDGADFERLLNDPAEKVNNLDLNDDDKVDYIKVTEYGSGNKRGFSLTTEVEPGKVQEIATIDFEKEAEKATVQTTGNQSMYGPGYYHHSSFGLTDALLMGWMFSNRPSYSSPYGWGNYPQNFGGGWDRRPYDQYNGDMSSRTAGSTFNRSSSSTIGTPALSPNAEKTAARAKAIANPTQSQRSFTTRSSEGRPVSSGGFGKSSSSSGSANYGGSSGSSSKSSGSYGSSSSSGSYGSSSKSSSGSSYGGSSSSGSSYKSSSPSSGSSSFGRSSSSGSSRSGGFGGGGK